ncbi:MAG TPA: 1,4-alpha-glucan branching protein domain-containing protein, partial [Candidatus Nanopelagicales bacterium]|nr:1,4-alpha-glucan branching protein domain-containing protein [Candidatus Nanopelagicales bacterium]
LSEEVVRFGLQVGLDDAHVRFGSRPTGLWAPECGHRPGLEQAYAEAGVGHLMLDGPSLQRAGRSTGAGATIGDSDVVVFGRDLEVTYRAWSPRKGYPGGRWYRDFHTVDDRSGLRLARVSDRGTPPAHKSPYDPVRARLALDRDADDFVAVVRRRLLDLAERRGGRPGLVVAGYDTELFGHWWHEGPPWLEAVLRRLPAAGVRVTTLAGAIAAGHVEGRVDPGPGSWGSGKDWRVWDGPATRDLVDDNARLTLRLVKLGRQWGHGRDRVTDQLATTGLLALASDWAFMVSKDSAAEYARARHHGHHGDFHALADALESGDRRRAERIAAAQHRVDGPFPQLDSRLLPAAGRVW